MKTTTTYTYILNSRNASEMENKLFELKNNLIQAFRIGDYDLARKTKSEINVLEDHYKNELNIRTVI